MKYYRLAVNSTCSAQAVVRFLWDAHNCEEAREEEELVVSTPYIEHWNDLIDLWYLGMQVPLPNPSIHVAGAA